MKDPYTSGYLDGLNKGLSYKGAPQDGETIKIPDDPHGGRGITGAIITAALIIALAMVGCAVIDYFTFREVPEYEEPVDEIHSGPSYVI